MHCICANSIIERVRVCARLKNFSLQNEPEALTFCKSFYGRFFMAKFYCKYCGREASSISSLTAGSCQNSPTKKHVSYEGTEKKKYCCMYCGRESSSIFSLTAGSCQHSPTKKHVPYEGDEKKKYCCKYCGRESSSIFSLTGGSCSKSPIKRHVPLR